MVRNGILLLVVCLLCLLGVELGLRLWLGWNAGLCSASAARCYYPELSRALADPARRDDAHADILLLGGSVLEWLPDPRQALTRGLGLPVRVDNLGKGGHTSRDSLIKYSLLADSRYDAVVIYHAINEVRANNCPPDLYREDYGHYAWYSQANALLRPWARCLLAPTLLEAGLNRLRSRLNADAYVPPYEPRDTWLQHGRTLKTPQAFRKHLTAILDQALVRGDRVLLLTFALHLPEGYDRASFEAGNLDYAIRGGMPAETWGEPEAMRRGVAAHNAVIRELAAWRGVPLLDMATLLPDEGRLFIDPCHLTPEGYAAFTALLTAGLRELPARMHD